jgi:hypothetical protein
MNVGSQSPQTFIQFGNTIYFCDQIGRPWKFDLGSAPVPIWHQLRGIVDVSSTGSPLVTARVATAVFEGTFNLYCVAIWSPQPSISTSPIEWHAFDALTGTYVGRWSIGGGTGTTVDCLGSFIDSQGLTTLVVLGSATVGGPSGFAWGMSDLAGVPDFLTLEDGTTMLTDESTPPVSMTTEGQTAVWMDNGAVPLITVTTDRLGYADDTVWLYDQLTVLTGTPTPLAVTVTTPLIANTLEGTPTPNPSTDGINRTAFGLDVQGRGMEVTVSPTTADSQWSLDRLSVVGIPSAAMMDDD